MIGGDRRSGRTGSYERMAFRNYDTGQSPFDDLIRQFVRRCGSFRKMRGEHLADLLNRSYDSVTEFLAPKMRAHLVHNALPKLLAAFLVDRCIAHHRELVRAWRDENQHRIPLACLVHTKLIELPLRCSQRIGVHFSALNKNANLPGSV